MIYTPYHFTVNASTSVIISFVIWLKIKEDGKLLDLLEKTEGIVPLNLKLEKKLKVVVWNGV